MDQKLENLGRNAIVVLTLSTATLFVCFTYALTLT
jgi:hypothetical protein